MIESDDDTHVPEHEIQGQMSTNHNAAGRAVAIHSSGVSASDEGDDHHRDLDDDDEEEEEEEDEIDEAEDYDSEEDGEADGDDIGDDHGENTEHLRVFGAFRAAEVERDGEDGMKRDGEDGMKGLLETVMAKREEETQTMGRWICSSL